MNKFFPEILIKPTDAQMNQAMSFQDGRIPDEIFAMIIDFLPDGLNKYKLRQLSKRFNRIILRYTKPSPPITAKGVYRALINCGSVGSLEIIKENISPGIFGDMPLFETIKHGNKDVLKLLLSDPRVNPEISHNWALITASREGKHEMVAELLKHPKVNPNDDDNMAIILASEYCHVETVKTLLGSKKLDITDDYHLCRALIHAATNGSKEIVEVLIERGVSPNGRNNSAIIGASANGHDEVVKILLKDQRVNPADKNNDAIFNAARNGHTNTVKLLISDPRVNPADWDNIALVISASHGHLDTVTELLKHPSVDIRAGQYKAIVSACTGGHRDIAKLLISRAGKLNSGGKKEATDEEILDICVSLGNPVVVKHFIQNNKQINGGISISRALRNRAFEIAKILLSSEGIYFMPNDHMRILRDIIDCDRGSNDGCKDGCKDGSNDVDLLCDAVKSKKINLAVNNNMLLNYVCSRKKFLIARCLLEIDDILSGELLCSLCTSVKNDDILITSLIVSSAKFSRRELQVAKFYAGKGEHILIKMYLDQCINGNTITQSTAQSSGQPSAQPSAQVSKLVSVQSSTISSGGPIDRLPDCKMIGSEY